MPIGDGRATLIPRTARQIVCVIAVLMCSLALWCGSLWAGQQAHAEESSDSSASSSTAAASSASDSSEESVSSEASASAANSSSQEKSADSKQSTDSESAAVDVSEADDPFEDAVSVELADGIYLIDVTLEGGTGKASVESPALLEVFDGRGVITLVWSSPHYDYMVVNEKKYLPVNEEGNSKFNVPVVAYDSPFSVIGDTTAMGEPHEINYEITVALDSAELVDENTNLPSENSSGAEGSLPWPWIIFIACVVLSGVCIGVTIGVLRGYRNR